MYYLLQVDVFNIPEDEADRVAAKFNEDPESYAWELEENFRDYTYMVDLGTGFMLFNIEW